MDDPHDDDAVWQEAPDWLRPSRAQVRWVNLRVALHRSLGIPPPSYVGHNGGPIGPRRLLRRLTGRDQRRAA
jgi:hypothetical protein